MAQFATSLARFAKLLTGWSAHLFYWVYPGIMVAFMATLIGYIYNQFTGQSLSTLELTLIGVIFTIVAGYIAATELAKRIFYRMIRPA